MLINLQSGDDTSSNVNYEKVSSFLQKIFEYLQKIDVAYKRSYDKDQSSAFSNDYPYRNFWIDYLKFSRKFFKKSEHFNTKSTIENESNSSNKITDFKIITNEIGIMLEESDFIENLIILMVSQISIDILIYLD